MTRRASALAATLLICSIYVFFAYIASRSGRFNAAEPFGAVLGLLAFPALLSAILGFVGGAVRSGAFKDVFFWSYIVLVPLWTVAFHLGSF